MTIYAAVLGRTQRSTGELQKHLSTAISEAQVPVQVITFAPDSLPEEITPHREPYSGEYWLCFHRLCIEIEAKLPRNVVTGDAITLIVTDLTVNLDGSCLRPRLVGGGEGWHRVLAMLTLAYPEVVWLADGDFETVCGSDWPGYLGTTPVVQIKEALLRAGSGATPLFARSPIRTEVLEQFSSSENVPKGIPKVLKRATDSAAIDDEISYAHFLAYLAYRSGMNCEVVRTLKALNRRFGPESSVPLPKWVLEDRYLNFPDGRASMHMEDGKEIGLSDGRARNKGYRISQCSRRMLVTSSEISEKEKPDWPERIVHKPFCGMFDPDFPNEWATFPIERLQTEQESSAEFGKHSTEGLLLQAVDVLMTRARLVSQHGTTVEALIFGAVLASEALEISGGLTPTTAWEALALQHELEVRAECRFMGAGGSRQIEVDKRVGEIRHSVNRISAHTAQSSRATDSAGVTAAIVRRLVKCLCEANRFDEAERMQHFERVLTSEQWLKSRKAPLSYFPVSLVARLIIEYTNFTLRSLRQLAVGAGGWFLLVILMFRLTSHYDNDGSISFLTAAYLAATSCIGVGAPDSSPWKIVVEKAATLCAMSVGLFHIAIGASFAFRQLFRRI